jgi:hypothetical protein
MLQNRTNISLLLSIFLLLCLAPLQAGEHVSDFRADLGDSSNIYAEGEINVPLQLSIEDVLFEKGMDTLLTHDHLWGTTVSGNSFGGYPLVRAPGNLNRFYVSYLSLFNPDPTSVVAAANQILLMEVDTENEVMVVKDTLGGNLHQNRFTSGLAYSSFFFLGLNSTPAPGFVDFFLEGDEYLFQWGTEYYQGRAPIMRSGSIYTLPRYLRQADQEFRARPLSYLEGYFPSDPPPESFVITRPGSKASTAISGWGMDATKAVSVFGPVCVDGDQFTCENSDKFLIRWDDLLNQTIEHTDSVTPTIPASLNATNYNLAVATDSAANILVLWTEGPTGDDLYAKSWGPSANRRSAATEIASNLDVRNTDEDGSYRIYEVKMLQNNEFMVTYAQGGVIYYKQISLSANNISVGSPVRISPAGGECTLPTMNANRNFVTFAYFRESGFNRKYEFVRMVRNELNFTDTLIRQGEFPISFDSESAQTRSFLHSYFIPSIAADLNGNILVAFNHEDDVYINAWNNQPIYYAPGSYTSSALDLRAPDVSHALTTSDSVHFTDFHLFGITERASTTLQRAASADFSDAISMGDTNVINGSQPYHSATNHYRYTISMNTTSDRFYTPYIDSLQLRWNLKPRKPEILSVNYNSASTPQDYDSTRAYPLVLHRDSVFLSIASYDLDNPDSLVLHASLDGVALLNPDSTLQSFTLHRTTAGYYTGQWILTPYTEMVENSELRIYADDGHWHSEIAVIHFTVTNDPPSAIYHLESVNGVGAMRDTLLTEGSTHFLQAGTSVAIHAVGSDQNNFFLDFFWEVHQFDGSVRIQSSQTGVAVGDTLDISITAPDENSTGPDTVFLRVSDGYVSESTHFVLLTNNDPLLDSLSVIAYIQESDTTWELVDRTTNLQSDPDLTIHPETIMLLQAHARDEDRIYGDQYQVEWHRLILNPETGACCLDSLLGYGDTLAQAFAVSPPARLRIRTSDLSAAYREDTLTLLFPHLDTIGSGLEPVQQFLQDSLNFIAGANHSRDTIAFQIGSNGNAPLRIYRMYTSANQDHWFHYQAQWSGGDGLLVEHRTDSSRFTPEAPLTLPAGENIHVEMVFFTEQLSGDLILDDTLFIETNDFYFPVIKMPIHLEFNDLPTVRILWRSNSSHQISLLDGQLPFHSSLVFHFSEPIDTSGITEEILVYSYLDSLIRADSKALNHSSKAADIPGAIPSLYPGTFVAKNSQSSHSAYADSLIFTPDYLSASDYFEFTPPPHSFVHSDTIRIQLFSSITDSAGNPLDLRQNKQPNANLDSIYSVAIDTSFLQVISTNPPADSTHDPEEVVQIKFSHPLSSQYIFGNDTLISLDQENLISQNQSLNMYSALSGGKEIALRPFVLTDGDSTLIVQPLRKFFAKDTIRVRLSAGISDIFGHTLDGNQNEEYLYPPDSSDYYEFEFITGDGQFYVFPNPYRFFDPEHSAKGSISFKNLHRLKDIDPSDNLQIKIYTLDGLLVYSTKRNEIELRLENEDTAPQWDWNLKNNHGKTVASGIYLFVITHNHKLLRKGKLMVIH